MRQILALSNELIFEIRLASRVLPEPQVNILWVYFPSAKTKLDDWNDYVNQEAVWIGLFTDQLAKYPSQQKSSVEQITFTPGTALVNLKVVPPSFSLINLRHQKCYHLEEKCGQITLILPSKGIILPLSKPVITLCQSTVNQTVFVDLKGNDRTGRLEQPFCPFRTINAALKALPPRVPGVIWKVQLSVGRFPEVAVIPSHVELVGQGPTLTIIEGLIIEGQGDSGASNLTILPPSVRVFDSPVLKVLYNHPGDEINAQVTLSNVNLQYSPFQVAKGENAVVYFEQQSGQGGNIVVRECRFEADFSRGIPAQGYMMLLRTQNLSPPFPGSMQSFNVELRTSTFTVISPRQIILPDDIPVQLTLVRTLNTNISDVYGKYVLNTIPLEGFQQTLFMTEGPNFAQNHPTIELTVPPFPIPPIWENVPNYLLWYSLDQESRGGRIKSSSADVVLNNVRQGKVTLADTQGSLSHIRILGASFDRGGVPILPPGNKQITFAAHDEEGGSINKGALAVRIRKSSENLKVDPADHTIVVDIPDDIELYHIPTVGQTQIVKGSLLTIVNPLLNASVMIKGVIAGVPSAGYQLKPLESIQLNADDTQFYLTSSVVQTSQLGVSYPLTHGALTNVPTGATSMFIELWGGGGGGIYTDKGSVTLCDSVPGGFVSATVPYDPNLNYEILIGYAGGYANANGVGSIGEGGVIYSSASPSKNGGDGGASGLGTAANRPGGGGGACSAIVNTNEVMLVAAGSGGSANRISGCSNGGIGGKNSNGSGEDGQDKGSGGGATQSTYGYGGDGGLNGTNGTDGSGPFYVTSSGANSGRGGEGAYTESITNAGGGGGGGYYGGGGGSSGFSDGSGGGGGSSYAYSGATNVTYKQMSSVSNGSGSVVFS